MAQLQHSCPACGVKINYSERHSGKSIKCPKCQASLALPAIDHGAAADDFETAFMQDAKAAAVETGPPAEWNPEGPRSLQLSRAAPSRDDESYWALRATRSILRITGVLAIAAAAAIPIALIFATGEIAPALLVLVYALVVAFFVGLPYLATAELISLFINIAQDSRRQSGLLEIIAERMRE